MALMRCPECEKEISDAAISCPGCGYPLKLSNEEEKSDSTEESLDSAGDLEEKDGNGENDVTEQSQMPSVFTTSVDWFLYRFRRDRSLIITITILICVIAALVIVALFNKSTPTSAPELTPEDKFVSVGTEVQDHYYCILSDDKKSISVDTNPSNLENYSNPETINVIKTIHSKLGLPDSLYAKMNGTSALDGRQTDTYGDITVSWKYHPDKGLEIIYELVL